MTQFERFVTEGAEKADELAKAGAILDEGFMAEREVVYVALQYAARFHCSVEQWKGCEEVKPKPKEKSSNRVMRGQVPMHEMRKRKQMHGDARQI